MTVTSNSVFSSSEGRAETDECCEPHGWCPDGEKKKGEEEKEEGWGLNPMSPGLPKRNRDRFRLHMGKRRKRKRKRKKGKRGAFWFLTSTFSSMKSRAAFSEKERKKEERGEKAEKTLADSSQKRKEKRRRIIGDRNSTRGA